MYLYPKDLVNVIKQSWTKTKYHKDEKIAPLPSDDILQTIIEVCYHASFLTEESRKIGFRVVLENVDSLKNLRNEFSLIKFSERRKFSISEIMRLAPATDLQKMFIGIEQVGNELEIWGILDISSSWWDFTHGESSSGFPPPNCFSVSAIEPGNLTISRGMMNILSLRNGKMERPLSGVFYNGPISDFFKLSYKQFYDEICKELKVKKYDSDGHDNDYPYRVFVDFIDRIIFNIRNKHHGGAILFVKDDLNLTDIRLTDRVNVKYGSVYDKSWNLLKKDLILHRKYYDLYFSFEKKPINDKSFRELSHIDSEIEDNKRAIKDSIKLISSLSGVDGAIIMTDKLRLLCFGGEVKVDSPTLKEIKRAENISGEKGSNIPIESFGTRHRSAFRFCSSYEDAMAIVISQDGGVKAVKRVGSELILWPDINTGNFGM